MARHTRRPDPDCTRYDRVVGDRAHEWEPLTDEEYETRYYRLRTTHHAAVAAVLAHDPTFDHERMIS